MESMMHLSSNNHFITKLVIKFSLILQYRFHIQVDQINLYWCCKKKSSLERTLMSWKIIKCSGNQENAYLNKRNTRASRALRWAPEPGQSGICLICIAEANMIYIPWDHLWCYTLPTSWWTVLWGSDLRWQPNIPTYWHSPKIWPIVNAQEYMHQCCVLPLYHASLLCSFKKDSHFFLWYLNVNT